MKPTPQVIEKITIKNPPSSLFESEEVALAVTTNSSSATTFSWQSSNTDVAIIQDEKLICKEPGETLIKCTSNNNLTDQFKIVVKEIEVTGFELIPDDLEVLPIAVSKIAIVYEKEQVPNGKLKINDKLKIDCDITPYDATDRSVTWKVSDEKIAKYENGYIYPKVAGVFTVEVSASSGVSDSVTFTVVKQAFYVRFFERIFNL